MFFKQVADDLPPLSTGSTLPLTDFYQSELVIDQVATEMKLSCINIHKAPGPDGLPNWVLCDFCDKLLGPVYSIFNASVREGFVPLCWKEAHVILVPKVHPTMSIQSDLQPLSLTSTLGKILESFIGLWILEWLENQLDCRQYGALRKWSTTHALVDALHHWRSAVDNEQSVRTVFIDYLTMWTHNILVAKLREYGLSDVIIRWLCTFLTDQWERVKIRDVFSEWQLVHAGMALGFYLGPLTSSS